MKTQQILALALGGLSLLLTGFTPFTEVVNVCPSCSSPPTDVVNLLSGRKIPCTVVAQNNDYYVLARHGEYRAVKKSEVAQVSWKSEGGPANLGTGDQILAKGDVVLHGTIVAEKPGRLFIIQVGANRHIVWYSQVESVHKGGKPYPLSQP